MTTTGYHHLSGVGGSGMSPIAQLLAGRGGRVSGSDRDYDLGRNPSLFACLQQMGVVLHPQDGSGVDGDVARLITSGAIEDSNPEVRRALELGIPVTTRQHYLRELFEGAHGVAVAGTSGKTTTSGLLAFLLKECGLEPAAVLGGEIVNYASPRSLGSAMSGDSGVMVIELDESRAEMEGFRPPVGVLLNISKDHKTLEELEKIFRDYLANCGAVVINSSIALPGASVKNAVTFGLDGAAELHPENMKERETGTDFTVRGVPFSLNLPGLHNVENALAAIAAASVLGAGLEALAAALPRFRGMRRRFEIVAEVDGVRVVDDFGHNPAKIAASLQAARLRPGRILAVFQPHGYGPTRFLRDDLVKTFAGELRSEDRLFLLPIFDMGGTADRSISSRDLAADLAATGCAAECVADRSELPALVASVARPSDTILVMGARDPGLTALCRAIASELASTR